MSTVEPIAIVGIGCRFPGASGPDSFWRLLAGGVDAIREVPPDRWNLDDVYDEDPAAPGKMNTRWGGFLTDVDRFDAAFFGISPREAAYIDPQQRLLMEVAWEALEDAALPAETLAGQKVGVFVGMSSYDYGGRLLAQFDEIRDGYGNTGSALSIGANRISYLFDFRGPSVVIDTACSSSLVAAYYACQSLSRGECRIALAGGVNLILSPAITIGFSKLQAMAPDGRCKAFDAQANGYVRGEGAGVVVLKSLESAVADGDRIYALIRGGSVNQDGRTNGLTAPNGLSQEALLREALSNAGLRPSEIQYVEAHGTGTALGDPIELNALGAVLASGRSKESRCAVGSAKTNVGHLEAAAGMAGLIKLALSLERRQLPPSLHFNTPNPYIRFDVLPLRVVTRLEPWPADSGPARGGVSSFGFGGTNAHLVLEESPSRIPTQQPWDDEACVLPVSARSEGALADLARAYAEKLATDGNGTSFGDLCATAAVRRSHHDFRLAAVASSRSEMASSLAAFVRGERPREVEAGRRIASRRRRVAFVFPGQGSQWLGMGRELIKREPVFAEALERCARAFSEHVDWSLIAELEASPEQSRLEQVDVIQPAIFAIQVALGELWRSWGIKPDAVIGQSMGEVAAAHIAGALSLEDAARIICRRSCLVKRSSGRGAMAVVDLSFARSTAVLAGYEDRLAVAVSNSPTSTVLSGDPDALEEVLTGLEREGVFCRRVKVDYASHSPQMDPLREDLRSMLEGIAPRRTKVPLYSTVTGAIASGVELGPDYWVRNLREPVLFADAVGKLVGDGIEIFLEVSPHPILLSAIQQCLFHLERDGMALGSLRREENERRSLLSTLASLYAIGKPVDWNRLYPRRHECIPLPSYPWQRERFWVDSESAAPGVASRANLKPKNPLIGHHVRSAATPATHLWQHELGSKAFPFLNDHRVHGEIVVPATGYLEMALEAARESLGDEASFTLENVRFERALVLSEGEARQTQVVLTRQVPTRFEWQVFAETPGLTIEGDPNFSLCARGQIRVSASEAVHDPPSDDSLAAIHARCSTETSGAEHYRLMATVHLDYGPSFQGVEAVSAGDREAIARLRPAPSDARRYQMHPALLDAALQSLGAALSTNARTNAPRAFVPVSVDRFRLLRQGALSGNLWAHAVWTHEASRVRGDVRVLTEAGELVAEAIGIGLEPLERSQASDGEQFYAIAWEKQPMMREALPDKQDRAFLIFADSTGLGTRLAEEISGREGLPVLVTRGAALHVAGNLLEAGPCQIDPARGGDYSELLEELTRKGIVLDSVIHLWSLDAGEDPGDAAALGCQSVLLLVQALVQSGMEPPARLWLSTRSAQHVVEGDDVSPFRAPLWGLARTIAQEHPELMCTAIDLGPAASEIEAAAFVDELWQRHREPQVAFRKSERFVARLTSVDRAAMGLERPWLPREGETAAPFAAQLAETGNLSSVVYRQTARRRPAAGDVEIEVIAAGLNFRDVLLALGLLPAEGDVVLGHECAGRITALGDGVTGWAVGDEVLALAPRCLSSFVRTHASLVVAKPARLDFEEAATVPIAVLTAHYALNHLGRLQRDERVMVHSASGAVGLACIRLAQVAGAEIFATAGTEEKRRLLESLGVRRVMDSRSLSFADEVMEATGGEGVDVVVNSLAGEAVARGLEILRPGGRFIELGKRDLLEGGQIPLRCLEDSRSFFLVDLGRLAEKRADMCGRLLRESVQLFEEQQLAPLPKRVFPAADLANAFDLMARSRHIGKVVIRMDQASLTLLPPADASGRIRDDATYVLTGGLGGIALVVGRWLVEKGARYLVLIGRSEPSPESREAIATMERAGARVVVDRIDVADAEAVNGAFARWAQDLPPVRGIVHAAGVLDDGILLQQTPERFRRVMAPKVEGAWNVHRASLSCSLDFFLLFSSAASVIGSAAQSNYAAANQFLDALAYYRRARALPATSINWGPWSDVGLAARPDRGGRLELAGIQSLSPQQGVDALGKVLLGNMPQVSPMRVDWREWRASQPLLAEMPFFSRIDGDRSDRTDTPDRKRELLLAAPEERVAILVDRLRQHVASVLRLAASKIDVDQPLVTMGIDSLMAVELKNRVEREIGVAIPLLQLIKGPSLTDLARSLAGSIAGEAVAASDGAREESTTEPEAEKSLLLSLLSSKDKHPRQETV
jgi:acyl transferase domain-containing protein/Zn-dependent alcohol dehydrogenase/acyl carrier protein